MTSYISPQCHCYTQSFGKHLVRLSVLLISDMSEIQQADHGILNPVNFSCLIVSFVYFFLLFLSFPSLFRNAIRFNLLLEPVWSLLWRSKWSFLNGNRFSWKLKSKMLIAIRFWFYVFATFKLYDCKLWKYYYPLKRIVII